MELREYQKQAVSALWSWFRANPEGAPILCLPTGSGKSLIAAEAARGVCSRGIDRRVLIVAHRKELLEQNHTKVQAAMPWGNCSLYSAGLGRRETSGQVVVAGVQSVFNKAEQLGKFHLCIIDEVHLVSPEGNGRYRQLIEGLQKVNPSIRFCGLSASPYRLGTGLLTDSGDIWTDIAYEVPMLELIEDGYLSPLIGKVGRTKANLSSVTVRGGEYVASEMQTAFNRLNLVEAALEEVVQWGADRKSWLIFATGIAHADTINKVLQRVGIASDCVTGETPPLIRAGILEDFKAGRLRALVNVDVLTTGFDYPGIDLVAVMRATKSTALWVQMVGRGSRIAEGKRDCMILDFGNNAATHGPIDKVRIVRRYNAKSDKEEVAVETFPCKECDNCRAFVLKRALDCPECGYIFPVVARHEATPGNGAILSSELRQVYRVNVLRWNHSKYASRNTGKMLMKIDYHLDVAAPVAQFSAYACLPPDYEGGVAKRWLNWWAVNTWDPTQQLPRDVDEAYARCEELKRPSVLDIKRKDEKFWEIVKVVEYAEMEDHEEEDATGYNI